MCSQNKGIWYNNPDCSAGGKHFHSGEHLKLSLPYSTYGLDVIASIGRQRQREHKQFVEIQHHLNKQGVAINDTSVGRLYRLFLALMSGRANAVRSCKL